MFNNESILIIAPYLSPEGIRLIKDSIFISTQRGVWLRIVTGDINRESDQNKLIDFVKHNKILIVSDLLKGRGEFSADWTLVILKVNGENAWVLKSINQVMNVFGAGDIRITREGSLKIGKIGMQRNI